VNIFANRNFYHHWNECTAVADMCVKSPWSSADQRLQYKD
jgi:hypothetical protein